MRKRLETLVPGANSKYFLLLFTPMLATFYDSTVIYRPQPDFSILTHDSERISVLDDALSFTSKSIDVSDYSGERLLPLITACSKTT
jgi:hypothetical protein